MPIKKLRIAFDIDVNVLAMALAQHNTGMHIELAGPATESEPADSVSDLPLLPPPQPRSRGECQAVLAQIRKHNVVVVKDLKKWGANNGRTASSITNSLDRLHKKGYVRRVGYGRWTATAKGAANGR